MSYLPEQLTKALKGVPGFDEEAFRRVHETPGQVTAVRFNPFKYSGNLPVKNITDVFPGMKDARPVPWTGHGCYLPERPAFYLDPLWHAGVYYVQDASSMCLEFVLQQVCDLSKPLRVLDLCAAPGGKSTLMAGMISRDSLLVSNEVIGSRVGTLEENMVKWGTPNRIITQNDARDLGQLKGYFDVILVDAPCSGSGLFRKDPGAVEEWSPGQVRLCSSRQRRILADVMPALKENGVLLYATCSFSPEENEQICDYLLQEFPLENVSLPFRPEWHITETITREYHAAGYRFYPYRLDGEGFFLACFRRKDGSAGPVETAKKRNRGKPSFAVLNHTRKQVVERWTAPAADLAYILDNDGRVAAVPAALEEDIRLLFPRLKVISAGVHAGKIIRDQLVPGHALALSVVIGGNIPRADLPGEDALRYLRRESLPVTGKQRGWLLAAYRDHPLGWIKSMQGRANNYYPMNWRIRRPAGGPAISREE